MKKSKILNEAYHNYLREKKGSTVPAHALPAFKLNTTNPERKIKQEIQKYLTWLGHYCIIVDSSAHYNKDVGQYVKSQTTTGAPDLVASINGIFVGIEVKRIYATGKDRQSDIQKKVEQQINGDGGKYIIVADFMSFYEWYITNK